MKKLTLSLQYQTKSLTKPLQPANKQERLFIYNQALKWLGTPYHHQSYNRAGCDCLGLLMGLWKDLYGHLPEHPPPYSPDWTIQDKSETLAKAAMSHMLPINTIKADTGDIALIRFLKNGSARHIVMFGKHNHILHADKPSGVQLTIWPGRWRQRIAYCFRFPTFSQ